jgi:hypothetical protein
MYLLNQIPLYPPEAVKKLLQVGRAGRDIGKERD